MFIDVSRLFHHAAQIFRTVKNCRHQIYFLIYILYALSQKTKTKAKTFQNRLFLFFIFLVKIEETNMVMCIIIWLNNIFCIINYFRTVGKLFNFLLLSVRMVLLSAIHCIVQKNTVLLSSSVLSTFFHQCNYSTPAQPTSFCFC